MCACLTSDSDETEKVIKYISACKQNGINILPPDINESSGSFTISKDGNSIRFGLSAIKNIGKGPIGRIQIERGHKPFTSLLDFLSRENLQSINSKQIESLIYAGAFDSLDTNRARLVDTVSKVWAYRDLLKRYFSKMETYEKKSLAYQERLTEVQNGSKKKLFKEPELPVRPEIPVSEVVSDFDTKIRLIKERELLGYFVSGHILDLVPEAKIKGIMTVAQVKELNYPRREIRLIAIPSIIKEITTRVKKQKMASVVLEDKTGTIEVMIPPKTYAAFKDLVSETIVAGYKCAVEIVKNDDTSLVRLRVLSVHELPSQKVEEPPLICEEPKRETVIANLSEIDVNSKNFKQLKDVDLVINTSNHQWLFKL
jgi:DNA polymerase-3 subunit alpha